MCMDLLTTDGTYHLPFTSTISLNSALNAGWLPSYKFVYDN